jgi:hypothetical protein
MTPIRMRLLVGACALSLAFVGWRIWSVAAADSLPAEPEVAIAWQPADPFLLSKLAARGELSPDLATEAEGYARRALAASPLASPALRVLGSVAGETGDLDRARALMEIAADRWLFDAQAQSWLIRDRLASGQFADALYRSDIVLRSRPAARTELFPAMIALAGTRDAQPALAEVLSSEPPWRTAYLQQLANAGTDVGSAVALALALEERGSPPNNKELRPILRRLVDGGLGEQAFLLWARLLPPERLGELANVNNGGFEFAPTGLAFDWSIDPVEGAEVGVVPAPEGGRGNALRAEFNGGRVPFQHVSQVLFLAPGDYRLAVKGKAEGVDNERGFWWQVSCPDGTLLGATDRLSGTTPWTELNADFRVPAAGCATQTLRLSLAARVPIEQQVAGTVWFDDIAVSHRPPAGRQGTELPN